MGASPEDAQYDGTMNTRRALQIGMLLVMGLFLVEMFTPLHVASCKTTIDKSDEKTRAISTRGHLAEDAPVAFQVHGGDKAFLSGLRDAFKAELQERMPHAKFVDGPPQHDSALVRMTLTSADERWTPLYSHEGLGTHMTLQLPGAHAGTQITADATVDAVCTGLVSRGHFQEHGDTTAPLAAWLVDQLVAARAPGG